MKNRYPASSVVLAALLLGAAGCGEAVHPPADTPVVKKQTQSVVSRNNCSATTTECNGQAVEVTLTLDKARILGREFIYSLDLQFSSQYDARMDLYNQSLVAGHIPVVFRMMGNELQLVTDNKLKFPSDNNHPEDVIGTFRILGQTDSTLTVSGLDSAPFLASQLAPADSQSKQITYLNHWIRSFDFDQNGNYMLQQSSIKLGDGKTIAEFMESVFPRESLAPGASFQKFEMDPLSPVGASDGVVARFRFLLGDTIIKHDKSGEQKLSYATHYDISAKADGTPGTIDWYVTPNIPDEYLAPVKQGVEGWNRYFVKMKGIERPVMRFLGKLPEGIHIGDPRYNVINWDSRLIAGAAYESQSADPETGRQSHSLIYMPAAWLKIGADYWKKGFGSDATVTDPADGQTPKLRIADNVKCSRELRDGLKLMASGRLLEDEVKKFGIQLLKQTLFHEVGHALGFAHNFEGSLSYDPADPASMFSTSIMDYNDFELERAAFADVNSAEGPLLEYDRQTLSALYNNRRDVVETDPVLPACNDAEADNELGGVNPLCARYDLQKDPTRSVNTAIRRIEDAQVDSQNISLSQALGRIADLILPEARLRSAHSDQDVALLAAQFVATLKGSLDFYMISDVSALTRTVRTNIKTLLEYGVELPNGYDGAAMRERVFAGVQKIVSLTEIPAAPKQALTAALQTGLTRIASTPYVQGLAESERAKTLAALSKQLGASVDRFALDPLQGLPAARAKVLASLAHHTDVDFYLGKQGQASVDYERNIVSLLADVVSSKARTGVERIAAASALVTYKGRLSGNNAVAAIKSSLSEERVTAASNDERRTIETILATLGYN